LEFKNFLEISFLIRISSDYKRFCHLFKFDHPLVKKLVVTEEPIVAEPVVSNSAVVSECYRVTADVLPVLSKFGYE